MVASTTDTPQCTLSLCTTRRAAKGPAAPQPDTFSGPTSQRAGFAPLDEIRDLRRTTV